MHVFHVECVWYFWFNWCQCFRASTIALFPSAWKFKWIRQSQVSDSPRQYWWSTSHSISEQQVTQSWCFSRRWFRCGRISRLVVCLSVCQFFVNVLIKAELMQKQYRYMYMYSKTYYFVEQIMKNEKMFFH